MIDQEEIHIQCSNKNPKERLKALDLLKTNFSVLPNKQQAWEDLHKFTEDEEYSVRIEVTNALKLVFSQVSDERQAWEDLARLTRDQNDAVRFKAAETLVHVISQLPDKQQAWSYLHELAHVQNDIVRSKVAEFLGPAFSHLPDKQQAWEDLHKLTKDKDSYVKYQTACALGSAFYDVPDKQQAWSDLHRLSNDEECGVRSGAAYALSFLFSHIPDKQQAWNDLHRLTNDQDSTVRYWTTGALGSGFYDVPDKQQAWNDLIKLTNDQDSYVRSEAAYYIGSACTQVPDKQQAWNDLHKLITDEDSDVKSNAIFALGSVFSDVPDKQQAWNDLHKLITDEDSDVRAYANHSLGKVSIFKASQSEKEEEYKKELETAIAFFEKAAQESRGYNPAQFCLPFYRSFHLIIFKSQEAKGEVDKYLVEAKAAIEDSKSKETLLGAVINLANALQEVQNLENLDLETKKDELNFYRKYCDRAAELMRDTEKTAPFATIAVRKGLPILDRNLKELLEEIQKKAKVACKESKGTATEEIACTINREIQTWEIGNQEEMTFNVENLVFTLEANTPHNPQNNFLLDRIKQIPDQKDVSKQYNMLSSIITLIINSCLEQKLHDIGEKVDKVSDKLEEITISLKPGISEELIIHVGPISQWGGIEYTLTIPLQDISYPELKEDLQKIMGKKIDKLSKMPSGLAGKVRDYLIQKNMWSILDKLT